MSDKPTCAVRGAIRPGAMCSRILVGGELCGFAGECVHKIEPAEPMCQCGDRPAAQCPGAWEPGCDLGNNPAHAHVYQECVANGSGPCRIGPNGPNGEPQCEWCGEAPNDQG